MELTIPDTEEKSVEQWGENLASLTWSTWSKKDPASLAAKGSHLKKE